MSEEQTPVEKPTIANPVSEPGPIKHAIIYMPTTGIDESEKMKEVEALLQSKDAGRDELRGAVADLRELVKYQWSNNNYADVFKRLGAQRLEGDKGFISINTSSDVPKAGTYSGAAALRVIKSSLGIGKRATIPLWGSGVKIVVGNFKESDMLRLQIQIEEERERVMMRTRNLIYSADDVEVTSILLQFVLDHVIEHNVRDLGGIDQLRDLILVTDVQSMFAGGLASIYPNGYPIAHACTNRPACDWSVVGEKEKVEELPRLNFRRVIFSDEKRLDIARRRHMELPMNSVTVEQVKEYQRTLSPATMSAPLNDTGDIIFRLGMRVPTLREYENEMTRWIADITDEIVNTVETAKNPGRGQSKRVDTYQDLYRRRLVNQRNMCWISSIQGTIVDCEDEDNNIVTFENRLPYPEDDTLVEAIADISQDIEISNAILEVTEKFKRDAIVSMAGFPNFACPSCGSSQNHDGAPNQTLIPINMASYFFAIMGLRQAAMAG